MPVRVMPSPRPGGRTVHTLTERVKARHVSTASVPRGSVPQIKLVGAAQLAAVLV